MKSIKALLLDKKAELFEILGDIFNVTGHKLIVAKDENQALDLLKAVNVDIMLLPYRDRKFWFSSRKEHGVKGIYPMFIGEKDEELNEVINLGFSYINFIIKPFNPLDLLNRIGHLSSLEEHEDISIFGLINVLIEMEKNNETGYIEIGNDNQKCILFVEEGNLKESTCSVEDIKSLFPKDPEINKLPIVEDFSAKEQFESTNDFIEVLWQEEEKEEVAVAEKKIEIKAEDRFKDLITEIEEGLFWIHFKDERTLISKNSYIRIYKGNNTTISMLINPWDQNVWGDLKACVEYIVGDIKSLHIVILLTQDVFKNHNILRIIESNPKITLITTREIVTSMRYAGMPAFRTRTLDLFRFFKVTLATGHTIRFIPSPYTPYKGNFTLFEETSNIFFTPEIFSSMLPQSNFGFDKPFDPHGIKLYHMINMPHSHGVKVFLNNLDVKPRMVLPAHGNILKDDEVQKAINVISRIEMGTELPPIRDKQEAILILNETISYIKGRIDSELFRNIMSELERFTVIEKGRVVDVLTEPYITVDQIFISLCNVKGITDEIVYDILNFISEREVLLPSFTCL